MRLMQPMLFGLAAAIMATSPIEAQNNQHKNAPHAAKKVDAPVRTTPPTAEDLALAQDIMLIVADKEMGRRLVDEMFTMTPEQFFGKSPQMRSVEKSYPGITALLLKRMQIWFNGNFDAVYSGSIDAQAKALAQLLSTEDLRITADFLNSDAGKSFTSIAFGNVALDRQAMSTEMGKVMRGNGDVNFEAMIGFDENAMIDGFQSLPEDQQEAISEFIYSPSGVRFFSALDSVEQARLQFTDQFMADHSAEIEALAAKVFDDYEKGVR